MSEPNIYELCAKLPRRLVLKIGARIRAKYEADAEPMCFPPGCCDSCHQDHSEGYAGSDYTESFFDDDRYKVSAGKNKGRVPWAHQFCCCIQRDAFKAAIKAELAKREGAP